MERILEFIRGLVRPLVALAFGGTAISIAIYQQVVLGDSPVWFIALVGIIVRDYFEARSEIRRLEANGNGS
jgi:hypothetical protein